MTEQDMNAAADLFVTARRSGRLIAALPAALKPRSVADAHAIQAATMHRLGDRAAGFKVASVFEGQLLRGIIMRSLVFPSPARVAAERMPLLGIEAEIAFRFDRTLEPRDREYSTDEVAAAVTAFPAIEVVDSRFQSYADTPFLDRAADFVSNGGFVAGAPRPDWRDFDLAGIEVSLTIGGREIVRRTGGHAAGNPLLPAVALVNDLRTSTGIPAGQLVTTGTYTGLTYAKPGQRVVAAFAGFGSVELDLGM